MLEGRMSEKGSKLCDMLISVISFLRRQLIPHALMFTNLPYH